MDNMKYAILSTLSFDTPAKRDIMSSQLQAFIASRLTWGPTQMASGEDRDGKPSSSVEVRFLSQADANDLYDLIVDRIVHIPVLRGRVSKHNCTHDEVTDEVSPQKCVPAEEFSQ